MSIFANETNNQHTAVCDALLFVSVGILKLFAKSYLPLNAFDLAKLRELEIRQNRR